MSCIRSRTRDTPLVPAKRGTTILTIAAWIAYAMSWFLPVMPKSDLFSISAGWKAFLLVGSVVLKPDQIDPFWGLCIAGVLANAPVLISPFVLINRRPPVRFVVTIALAFVLNLVWIGFVTDTKLLVGYWLWVGSMGLLTVAAILRIREGRASEAPKEGTRPGSRPSPTSRSEPHSNPVPQETHPTPAAPV